MSAIHHLALNCVDRLALERFYTELFGFRRVRVFNPGAANEFVMLRSGDFCLELFSAAHPDRLASPVGFSHFAFSVDDLEATLDRVRALGVEPERLIDCGHLVEGLRICFFNDPEGNRVELMAGWRDDPAL